MLCKKIKNKKPYFFFNHTINLTVGGQQNKQQVGLHNMMKTETYCNYFDGYWCMLHNKWELSLLFFSVFNFTVKTKFFLCFLFWGYFPHAPLQHYSVGIKKNCPLSANKSEK